MFLTDFEPGIIGPATQRDIEETATNICVSSLLRTVLKAGNGTEMHYQSQLKT